jgi:hypothetical protein
MSTMDYKGEAKMLDENRIKIGEFFIILHP